MRISEFFRTLSSCAVINRLIAEKFLIHAYFIYNINLDFMAFFSMSIYVKKRVPSAMFSSPIVRPRLPYCWNNSAAVGFQIGVSSNHTSYGSEDENEYESLSPETENIEVKFIFFSLIIVSLYVVDYVYQVYRADQNGGGGTFVHDD